MTTTHESQKRNSTCFPELINVRPELVRLYWLGGDNCCDFSLSAANGETLPVGKAPADPSSMRDLGFTEKEGLLVGAFWNTDGVEDGAAAGFTAEALGVAADALAGAAETELLDFPF